jgi:hypothetical protein
MCGTMPTPANVHTQSYAPATTEITSEGMYYVTISINERQAVAAPWQRRAVMPGQFSGNMHVSKMGNASPWQPLRAATSHVHGSLNCVTNNISYAAALCL